MGIHGYLSSISYTSKCPPLWSVIWVNPSLHNSGCQNILGVMNQFPSDEPTVQNYFMFVIAQWHALHISFIHTAITELTPVKAVLMFWDRPHHNSILPKKYDETLKCRTVLKFLKLPLETLNIQVTILKGRMDLIKGKE